MMKPEFQVILCTCPNQETATKLARSVVEKKLAACVNIIPTLTSVYWWNDQVETASECLLMIKSAASHYEALETALRHDHPYEVPEIIALPIQNGLSAYLNWIENSVT